MTGLNGDNKVNDFTQVSNIMKTYNNIPSVLEVSNFTQATNLVGKSLDCGEKKLEVFDFTQVSN